MSQINFRILGGVLLGIFFVTFILAHRSSRSLEAKMTSLPKQSQSMAAKPKSKAYLSPSPLVTRSDNGDIVTTVVLSPSMSPLSPTINVTPVPTPHVSPSTLPTLLPIPSQSPSPTVTTPPLSPSPSVPRVVINEIAWMGTESSANDEWIELYNDSGYAVKLTGWMLKALDGSPSISLEGTIQAHGYYLIERTDDTTVLDVSADLVSAFGHGLSNAGENLILIDNHNEIMDQVDCSGGWFAGDNTSKSSMERKSAESLGGASGNWVTNNGTLKNGHDQAGNTIGGTPKQSNSISG
ncbi:lamin tail domain-containing protein [Candidatus Parcubacteria bacterium]|nr:lamin tail domain-containing protein [Candidatus Parcubacteria bacterium]